jgi:epoxide hydrolase 4
VAAAAGAARAADIDDKVTHGYADSNGVKIHYAKMGSGPLIVMIHGFPDYWYTWRHQMEGLADKFTVVAIDQRGYNLSDKPAGVENYDVRLLVGDVLAVIKQLGQQKAIVVGHDWGGVVAWFVAMWRPDVIERLVILNAPHPAAYLRELRRSIDQPLRSWYTALFQLPWLPEALALADDCAILQQTLRRDPARPGAFSDADVAEYVRAWTQPRAMTCAINYYRATFRSASSVRKQFVRIACPTLLIWGMRDRYLAPALADGLETWVPRLCVERLPQASHWVQHDELQTVNRLIVEFLTG